MAAPRPPVHDSLQVIDVEDIYRTGEWWKSVVRYSYDADTDHDEIAIYLWHHDDGWTRKNKYVVKTVDAWATDTTLIEQLWADESAHPAAENWPVSDYYDLGAGVTVFQSDGWWKAILKIVQKGSYETEEVMVYLWQEQDDDWRRRQKYTIKSHDSWREEAATVERVLDPEESAQVANSTPAESTDTAATTASKSDPETTTANTGTGTVPEFHQLNRELDAHLSAVSED